MRVSREFKQNFDLVARYYGLAEAGELEEAKEAVRRNPESAVICFAAMAQWVRNQQVRPTSVTRLPTITDEQMRKAGMR